MINVGFRETKQSPKGKAVRSVFAKELTMNEEECRIHLRNGEVWDVEVGSIDSIEDQVPGGLRLLADTGSEEPEPEEETI